MQTDQKSWNIPTIVSMNPIMVDGTRMCRHTLNVGDEVKFACVDGPEFDGHLVNFDEGYEASADIFARPKRAEPC